MTLSAERSFFGRLAVGLGTATVRTGLRPRSGLKEASVLAPLVWRDGEPWVILTQRPLTLRQHAGQISFPGGGREPEDLTPLHTALRESFEELGIEEEQVETLGLLSSIATVTSFWVTPFVGVVPSTIVLRPSADEIAEILYAPLLRLRPETMHIYGAARKALVWDHSEKVVWGATFQMLDELQRIAKQSAMAGPKVKSEPLL